MIAIGDDHIVRPRPVSVDIRFEIHRVMVASTFYLSTSPLHAVEYPRRHQVTT